MDFLNYENQLELVKKYKLKVTLKKDPIKGVCVFATKPIKKDEIILYYKIRIFDETTYVSPTNFTYTFSVITKGGFCNSNLIGDIDEKSFPNPINNVPFWGPFVNEPSIGQQVNAKFNPNIKNNLKKFNNKKDKFMLGDYVVYSISALKNVNIGDEILVFYGDEYERNYEIQITDDEKTLCDFYCEK